MTTPNKPVLVGVEASPRSSEAALWAAVEADLRHATLQLVVVNDEPSRATAFRETVREMATRCREQAPHLEISENVVRGHPVTELIRRSADAQLVVVGSRRQTALTEWSGSVSTAVATGAHCPAIVIHGRHDEFTSGPVVVGVDGSAPSRTALQFALDVAMVHHADVLAVLVLRDLRREYYWTEPTIIDINWERWCEQGLRNLAEQLSGWSEKYPGVAISKRVLCGHPVAELTGAASDAQMLVVGHRGSGGFSGLLLGSVASSVLHNARCPAAIAH